MIGRGCFAERFGEHLHLAQVDLTSFEASGVNFVGREATERATKSRGRMTLKFSM